MIQEYNKGGFSSYAYGKDSSLLIFSMFEAIIIKKLYDSNSSYDSETIGLLIDFFQLSESTQQDYVTTLKNLSILKGREYYLHSLDYIKILKGRELVICEALENCFYNERFKTPNPDPIKLQKIKDENDNLRRVLDRLNENTKFYYTYLNTNDEHEFSKYFTHRNLSTDAIKKAIDDNEMVYHFRANIINESLYTSKIFIRDKEVDMTLNRYDADAYVTAKNDLEEKILDREPIFYDNNVKILHDIYLDKN